MATHSLVDAPLYPTLDKIAKLAKLRRIVTLVGPDIGIRREPQLPHIDAIKRANRGRSLTIQTRLLPWAWCSA
jgi:hypothetical protein